MAFDGAGEPYKSGPSWGCAIVVIVVGLIAALAGWLIVINLF